MKTMLATGMAGLMIAAAGIPATALAGGHEWDTTGRTLTTVVVADLARNIGTSRLPVTTYHTPRVIYVPAPCARVYVPPPCSTRYIERVYTPSRGYSNHRDYQHRSYSRHGRDYRHNSRHR